VPFRRPQILAECNHIDASVRKIAHRLPNLCGCAWWSNGITTASGWVHLTVRSALCSERHGTCTVADSIDPHRTAALRQRGAAALRQRGSAVIGSNRSGRTEAE
jgi:hypothetical protein